MPEESYEVGWFAVLTAALQEGASFAELLENDGVQGPNRQPTKALINRLLFLEKFFEYVSQQWAQADANISTATGAIDKQRAAILEFGESVGLVTNNRARKEIRMLLCFAEALAQGDYGAEVGQALRDGRRAEIPKDIRVAAVETVREKFGIKDWGAARRALTDARRASPSIFKRLPIPGGDDGP